MKTYKGYRIDGHCAVEVHCQALIFRGERFPKSLLTEDLVGNAMYFLPLRRSQFISRRAEIGFDWGNESFKALQLALSLLTDALGEPVEMELCVDFHLEIIANLRDTWELTDADVRVWHREWKFRGQDATLEELSTA